MIDFFVLWKNQPRRNKSKRGLGNIPFPTGYFDVYVKIPRGLNILLEPKYIYERR